MDWTKSVAVEFETGESDEPEEVEELDFTSGSNEVY